MTIARCAALMAAASAVWGAPPARVAMLSYNIHHGEGMDRKFDLDRIAAVIRSVSPDIVSLQEVDRGTRRASGVDQAMELSCKTGMQMIYGRAMDYDGGLYGNAILTRLPVSAFRVQPLPVLPGHEPRAVAVADFDGFRFLATHLDINEADRLRAVPAIAAIAAERRGLPVLLAGDLNAVAETAVMKGFFETWRSAETGAPLPTIPVGKPARQIDYVLFAPAARWRVLEARVLDESVASDHRAIFAVLELVP